MEKIKRSIRLKTVRKFIAKTLACIIPIVMIIIGLMLVAPFNWLKIVLGYCWIIILLTIVILDFCMYHTEKKEVIEANNLFQKANLGNYKKVTFGNEEEVLFQMVIPCTSAVSMWEFEKKYCFLGVEVWDELYDYLYSMRTKTNTGYCVSFKVKKETVNFDSLKQYYNFRDDVYYMI